ncbi:MAG: ABC transporter ATP-binding protein [Verrucomicrobiota bacterium]|nr:ABC transporter ATP-binding protein [Verrucomicrobiota bacterium]
MASVRLENLRCSFTSETRAVDDVSLELETGELFCLLGPSGCGKSTLLRLIGGYLLPDAGRVWIEGKDMTAKPPERRNTGMVFQNYALFPHLNALDNVAFGLRVKGMAATARLNKANEMLDWVGLTSEERTRRPANLSGGQQQRVALARALAFGPSLLMLDEPFANLDRLLRERLREELKQVQRRAGTTTILVTHDREEALALGDRIAIMHRGKLLQIGTPEEVYRQPANETVAEFLGHRNLFQITNVSATTLEAAGVLLPKLERARVGDYVLLWPNELRLHRRATENCLPGMVRQRQFAGTHVILTVELNGDAALEVQQPLEGSSLDEGASVWVEVAPPAMSLVPSK